jgi:adenylosuccinate lyase
MQVVGALAGLAASAHKFATDLRLLAHLKEIEEPFKEKQVGSSAMPYKRNPILSERLCGLARFLISLQENPAYTASTQWLERSLDDSANRRLVLPEAFLTADAILELLEKVSKGLKVYPQIILQHVQAELPFLATENILMEAVKEGGDRQELHEKLRKYSLEATRQNKEMESAPSLLDIILQDPAFKLSKDKLESLLQTSQFVGCAPQQVHEFIQNELMEFL